MARYFFHSADGIVDRDTIGTELVNDHAARSAAVRFAAEYLAKDPNMLWESRDFRVDVTDENGETLFTVITVAIDGPGLWRRKRSEMR
jgi:hypothetical protein